MKRILFRCDSSSTIGLGHVKRCLVLAKRLKELNKNLIIFFSTLNLDGNINEEILKSGFNVCQLKNDSSKELNYLIKVLNIDFLIIDSYSIDYTFEKQIKLKHASLKILCFDDMINSHCCDIVLNHGIQAKSKSYKKILDKKTKLFCGSKYTLLRDEFFEYKNVKTIKNSVAVILGGNDILNLSSKIVNLLLEINNKYKITVITSGVNPNLEELKQINIEVFVDISNIAEVLSYKEFIICASGGTLFEVIALNKKFINIEVANNQKVVSRFLKKKKIKTTIKAQDLSKKSLEKRIHYVNKKSIMSLALKFSKYKLAKKILKELI